MDPGVRIRRGEAEFRGSSVEEVAGWARAGRVFRTDFIFDTAVGSWLPASDHPVIGPAIAVPAPARGVGEKGRSLWWRLTVLAGCCTLVVVALSMVGKLFSGTRAISKVGAAEAPAEFRPAVGEKARLTVPSGLIVVCNTKADYKEYIRLAVANDMLGIANLMLSGHGFAAQPGTQVLVIDTGFEIREVRMLEGQFFGRSGWVNSDRLAKP